MNQCFLRTVLSCYGAFATLLLSSTPMSAAILYEQDFEGETFSTLGYTIGLLSVQPDQFSYEIAPNAGTAGSSALVYTFDGSRAERPFSLWNFGKSVNAIHDADSSRLRFSVDIRVVGTLTATSVRISIHQTDLNYEAKWGIDANNDGDMIDGAENFRSKFSPTLIGDDGFVTASFMLDQGTLEAEVLQPPTLPAVPIKPVLDASLPMYWSISFGSDGFGFDAGNSIALDNIKIELIPEPRSLLLALFSSVAILFTRRQFQPES